MPARLIINADDFGLTPGINRAIIELHQAGAVSSATLMATGPAFADAVTLALANPTLGVGCHIVLLDGTPVSPPETIPTLLAPNRQDFRPNLSTFVCDLFLDRIDEADIEREALAQIQTLQQASIDVTHLDTHKHTHIFPAVLKPVLRAARQRGVQCFRNPFEPLWSRNLSSPAFALRKLQLKLLDRFAPAFRRTIQAETSETTTAGTLGILATGVLDASLIHRLVAGVLNFDDDTLFELCCHPGHIDSALEAQTTRLLASREAEYRALLELIPQILKHPVGPQLIHYGNLSDLGLHRASGHSHTTGSEKAL